MHFILLAAVIILLQLEQASAFLGSYNLAKSVCSAPTHLSMGIKVVCKEDEPVESMIRRFKRAVSGSGKMAELRYKEEWETAAERKKRKHAKARLLNRIERTNDRYENRAYGGSEYNS